ncbi:hypothetical protein F7731_18175 [Cytobacillus depressus]|uniref:Uncharacterized protein n=1 Tax=Cytobacillus depressus TaxID=1602942 RepID=A0A6L3V124_9BACI|nr:hypothetical protein [Cytobacillus depressus]KAB2331520.1 hypothetical protein F7731_18175 [Cytobacillus depressus]
MSEFMKNIVQEVLKPAKKPRENPLFGEETKYIYSRSTVQPTAKNNEIQTIQGISRPNYQQRNIQKRLAGLPVNPSSHPMNSALNKHVSKNTHTSKENIIHSLSKLQTISLVQGKQTVNPEPTATKNINRIEESQLIGQSNNGIKAWIFSSLHAKLRDSFQRSLKSHAIGVITSEQSAIGQLFHINDMLREFPALKYSLTWEKESKDGFVLELYEEDSERLTKAVQTLFQKLSKHSVKQIQTYKVQSPSPWLTKQLNLKTSVDGAAVLEGIDHYSAILLLDCYFKSAPNDHFGYAIEKNYLLLYGNFECISKASEELQIQAARLFNFIQPKSATIIRGEMNAT